MHLSSSTLCLPMEKSISFFFHNKILQNPTNIKLSNLSLISFSSPGSQQNQRAFGSSFLVFIIYVLKIPQRLFRVDLSFWWQWNSCSYLSS
ncbi:hypothetical protein Pfo_010800 [Paulownia fortunei]|nr:hypothetical protein Pfo_010800 [Paulownia fortunei]